MTHFEPGIFRVNPSLQPTLTDVLVLQKHIANPKSVTLLGVNAVLESSTSASHDADSDDARLQAGTGQVILGTSNASPGERVNIPITIKDSPGFAAIELHISYDASKLQPVKEAKGEIDSSSVEIGYPDDENIINLNWSKNGSNITGDLTVIELIFQVKDNAAGKAELEITEALAFNDSLAELLLL